MTRVDLLLDCFSVALTMILITSIKNADSGKEGMDS